MTELDRLKEEFWEKWSKPRYSIYEDAAVFVAEEKRGYFTDLDRLIEEARKENKDD